MQGLEENPLPVRDQKCYLILRIKSKHFPKIIKAVTFITVMWYVPRQEMYFFKYYLDELPFEGLIMNKKCDLINKQYNIM